MIEFAVEKASNIVIVIPGNKFKSFQTFVVTDRLISN